MGRWYTPVFTEATQERESAAFGTLTTADEVKNVVLPANGMIVVAYLAKASCTVAGAGRAAIFIGANQLKNTTLAAKQEAEFSGTGVQVLSSTSFGLNVAAGATAFTPFTGAPISPGAAIGGPCYLFAEAGTYNVSIQYAATSGKVLSKERRLWVGVIGV